MAKKELSALRGVFTVRGGHTEEDVNSDFSGVRRSVGVRLGVLWAFRDVFGYGGDSEYVLVDDKGRLRQAPSELGDFLMVDEGDVSPDVAVVADACRRMDGKILARSKYTTDGYHNFTLRTYIGEAPKM